MMAYQNSSALAQYQSNGAAGAISDASPHRLIQLLLAGALDRLAQAKGGIQRGDRARKLHGITKAVAIIEHLRLQLDFKGGGQIARNLDALYDYMLRRLPQANAADDVVTIDEVSGLLRDIKSAWDAIPQGRPGHH